VITELKTTELKNREPHNLAAVILLHSVTIEEELESVLKGTIPIFLDRSGVLSEEVLHQYSASGRQFFRIDSGAGLCAEVGLAIEAKLQAGSVGSIDIDGVKVIAGGLIGPKGCVVINSITQPTQVVGIADGAGGLLSAGEEISFSQQRQKVEAYLLSNL